MDTFPQLATLTTSHFKQVYQAPPNPTLEEVIRVAQLFPRFVDQEDSMDLNREVTLGELEATLKWFKRDKSPGLDGWSVEFYLPFLYPRRIFTQGHRGMQDIWVNSWGHQLHFHRPHTQIKQPINFQ